MKKSCSHYLVPAGVSLVIACSIGAAAAPGRIVEAGKMSQWTSVADPASLTMMEERVKAVAPTGAAPSSRTTISRKATTDPSATVATVVDDGTRIVANIINWFMGDFLGVGQLRPMPGAWPEKVFTAPTQSELSGSGGVVIANGKVYKCKYGSAMGQVYSAVYNVYDMASGKLETSIELPGQWYSIWEHGAYNPVNGKIYVMGYDGMARSYISELNVETGVYTQLVQCNTSVMGMDFDATGQLYAITDAGELVRLDLTTGQSTPLMRIEDPGVSLHYWHSIAFDRRTGELFWFRTDETFNTSLRLIDMDAKTVTQVSEMPTHFGTNYAYVVSPEAPAKAPDVVTAVNVAFGADPMHGDVSVTAPDRCFDYSPLTGNMTVTVYVDGNDCGHVEAAPGATVTVAGCEFVGAGQHKVSAVATNAAGNSPEGSVTIYCGSDIPVAVGGLEFAITSDGTANVRWDAPEKGIHDGAIDSDALTYTVTRYPGGEIVADGLKDTSFSEPLGTTLARYYYGVTARCNGLESDEALSNSLVWGEGMSLPIDVALGEQSFFELCEVFDLDGDGNSFYQTWGSASAYSAYADVPYASNDWLITPPITLKKGNYRYEMTYLAAGDPVNATLTMGRGPRPEAQTEVLHEIRNLLYQHGVTTTALYISVPEDGNYYFGINFTSVTPVAGDLSMPYGSFQKLRIYEGPRDEAPAEVTDLKGTPAPQGELKTTLTFTAPSQTYAGGTLGGIDRIEVCDGDDNILGTVTDVVPGRVCTFVDDNAHQGDNTYCVYACNEAGRGKVSRITVYAGQDVPGLITSLKYAIENNRVLTFEWGAPTAVGLNGGYCNPSEFTYDFCRSQYSNQMPTAVVGGTGLTERRFVYTECGADSYYGTIQHQYLYGIQAVNALGAGALGYVGIMCGDPFAAPFSESFAGGANSHVGWSSQVLDGEQAWSVSTGDSGLGIYPYDGDGGMLLFNHDTDGQTGAAVISPFLALEKMANPVLEFAMWHNADAPREAYLSVQASRDNGAYVPVESVAAGGNGGWTIHKMPLKDFNGSDRVFIAFLGVNERAADHFAIDAIRVYDDVDHDLAVTSFASPSSIALNEEVEVNVEVKNAGRCDETSYVVEIYGDGERIAEARGGQLVAGGVRTVPVRITVPASMARREVELTARVVLAEDGNSANDESDAIAVSVGGSRLPAPLNVVATEVGDDVALTWDVPTAPLSESVVDGFEDYEAFAITSCGDWAFVDGDGLAPCGIGGIEYPNMAEGRAFMVWNVSGLSFADKGSWSPYGGDQCLIAFASDAYTVDGTFDGTYQSDEWLVSPHVAGGSRLSFRASAPAAGTTERFEVMVSYGGRTPEDFTSLSGEVKVTEAGWKEYEYTLPADAEYFAIRYVSNGREAFAMMFDDVEYVAGYSEATLMGYNVYADDECVNASPVDERGFTTGRAARVYGVSAVYAEGESEATRVNSPAGVESVTDGGICVKGERGCVVIEGGEGLRYGIYTLSGQAVATGVTSGADRRPVAPGVYVVTVGSRSYKVIIK